MLTSLALLYAEIYQGDPKRKRKLDSTSNKRKRKGRNGTQVAVSKTFYQRVARKGVISY